MDARREFVADRNSLQQSSQSSTLRRIQPEAYRYVMSSRHLADAAQRLFTGIGQPERVDAPVLGIRLADYESPLLQGIDHRNQPAGVHIQFSRQVLLTDGFLG
jgi:hypothetical protein